MSIWMAGSLQVILIQVAMMITSPFLFMADELYHGMIPLPSAIYHIHTFFDFSLYCHARIVSLSLSICR